MTCPTFELVKQLIARPSVTPEDGGCQKLIAERLQQAGFYTENLFWSGVSNLWARHGKQSPLLVFAGHTDVVPPGDLAKWTSPPFEPTIRDGSLYGRGAADMKGGVAAIVTACEAFVRQHPQHPGSIGILLTSDEEGEAIYGTEKVLERLIQQGVKIDACLVGEPTSSQLLGDTIRIGRRGSLTGHLKVYGKQGHVAYPLLADNPIHKAIMALEKLVRIEWDKGNPHFPPTHLQISNIHSGTGASNVIPGELGVDFNLRFSPETTVQTVEQRVEKLLKAEKLNYELTWKRAGLPFYTQPGKLTTTVQSVIREKLHLETVLSTGGGTSDGRFFAPLGVEVVELGLINVSVHQVDEHVRISDLKILSKLYTRIMQMFLC